MIVYGGHKPPIVVKQISIGGGATKSPKAGWSSRLPAAPWTAHLNVTWFMFGSFPDDPNKDTAGQ